MNEIMAPVGWQGIILKAPNDWSLVGVSGDEKKGYFRVDSPVASAVEVKWSAALGKPPDLRVKAREFLASMEKSCKKSKVKFASKLKNDEGDPNSVGFTWRADRLGQGRILYCRECDRVIIAQIISGRGESLTQVAPIILGSLRDHGSDGWVSWALYGLEFKVPEGFRMERQKLMSGYLSLSFAGRGRTLVVERWGLAGTLLESGGLRDWFSKDVLPDLREFEVDLTEGEVSGHEAIVLNGKRGGLRHAVRSFARSFTLHPHPNLVSGWAWHCSDTNRLLCVRATHAPGDDVAQKVRESIRCHGK